MIGLQYRSILQTNLRFHFGVVKVNLVMYSLFNKSGSCLSFQEQFREN